MQCAYCTYQNLFYAFEDARKFKLIKKYYIGSYIG